MVKLCLLLSYLFFVTTMTTSPEPLLKWLQQLLDDLQHQRLSREQHVLLLQHYAKHQLLQNQQPVQEDDWDWISVGLLLRQMVTTTE